MVLSYFMIIFPIMAVLSAFLYLPIYVIQRKKYGKRPFLTHLANYGLIGVVASILYLTIFIGGVRLSSGYHLYNLIPFVWVKSTYTMGFHNMVKQLLLNIGMFVPFGFFLPFAVKRMRKWNRTFLTSMMFSFAIEFVQYFIGRSADVDDLIMNTLGGVVGYVLFYYAHKIYTTHSVKKAGNQADAHPTVQ